jgi:hypothetical protein
MKLKLKDTELLLEISESCNISFQREWISHLRTLPYEQYGDYIKSTIYPALSEKDKMIWIRSTISNRELYDLAQTF